MRHGLCEVLRCGPCKVRVHQTLEQAAACDADLVGDPERRLADNVLDACAEFLRNVLHERAAPCHGQHLKTSADREDRQVRSEGASYQIELVLVTAGLR